MILWTIKLLRNVRQAIAGRNQPYQLAWAVAFGLVLGMVPHGNLVAVTWLIVILSLNLNHSMAAITAIGSSFAAGYLDPYSHRLGEFLLAHPGFREPLAQAWQWPLVPWTDLNNTIVLGSVVMGLAALLPVFVITYPVFRYLGRRGLAVEHDPPPPPHDTHQVVVIDASHTRVARPHTATPQTATPDTLHPGAPSPAADDFVPLPDRAASKQREAAADPEERIAVETRIDVIRLSDYRAALGMDQPTGETEPSVSDGADDDSEPMDDAFRYLLRQLRDSKQRKAA